MKLITYGIVGWSRSLYAKRVYKKAFKEFRFLAETYCEHCDASEFFWKQKLYIILLPHSGTKRKGLYKQMSKAEEPVKVSLREAEEKLLDHYANDETRASRQGQLH